MRHIILDLKNGVKNELFGKDLVLTDAPSEILKKVSEEVKISKDVGYPAEEIFIQKVKENGFNIKVVDILESVETYFASADNY